MKTTHLTSIITSFNPFARSGAVPRLFLQLLPPQTHREVKITQNVQPRSSKGPASLEISFRDGKKMNWTWTETLKQRKTLEQKETERPQDQRASLNDVVEEVERHTRVLGRKEELSG